MNARKTTDLDRSLLFLLERVASSDARTESGACREAGGERGKSAPRLTAGRNPRSLG